MKLNVKFYASCREQTGIQATVLEVSDTFSTLNLIEILVEMYPDLKKGIHEVTLAVNKKYIRGEVILNDGDEVALIPPISGG